ncbi:hypothetical protein [Neisseria lactamica]|uniref:hypothetical protein n=1 Tax=Neisseria lactamica TaxID=486 RepID=UPI001864F8BF|nr:hypothetical protein [Neisseria lactamica]
MPSEALPAGKRARSLKPPPAKCPLRVPDGYLKARRAASRTLQTASRSDCQQFR